MASRLSFCATPTRIALAPLSRRAHPCLAKAKAAAKADAKAAALERARQAEERWIEKLKAEHGGGWKAIFDESQARKERNAEAIRAGHRQAKLAKQQQQQQQS
ncbi:hypothetical protein M406DRAFT_71132 [Cryphonectria parasitica EP155]|uniref:Uncharacterized protein n=1 Tax=Cryphonectria parasitica (strain ATCC 38755 / EP155) TaxID=660469 RepID=A0A9P4Y0V2_CRYP1|nr:uncharacterized protein M406DRAFT_71132 [Cryphonectria parasitica EP155]KAF3764320.1 hypothetical protein M406DRAFT_71132 [Cryphonectria parasitica EP155]